jgi:hypothetical protein
MFRLLYGSMHAAVCSAKACSSSAGVCRFKGPLTLLDGFFHMHGLGTSIITRRFRNGTELSPLAQLRMFDYEFQVRCAARLAADCILLPCSACHVLHVYFVTQASRVCCVSCSSSANCS